MIANALPLPRKRRRPSLPAFNKRFVGGGGELAWTPLQAPSSLVAFYLPGIGQTVAGGLCSAWADQSGNSATLTAAGSARPTSNTDGSLTGDGVANIMQTAAFGAALTQPFVVTMLARQDSYTSGDTIFDKISGANFTALYQIGSSPTVAQFCTGNGAADSTLWGIGAFAVVQAVFNGAGSTLQINNNTATTGNPGATSMDGLSLFGRGDLANFANVTVKGLNIRSASDATINANDRNFWLQMGSISP